MSLASGATNQSICSSWTWRILVLRQPAPYDPALSPQSEAVIPYVLKPATIWHAEIDVLHVCSSANCQCHHRMDDLRRRMEVVARGETPLEFRYHVLPGPPSPTILNFAIQEKEDLIVLGLENHRSPMVVHLSLTPMKLCVRLGVPC
jgi:hypothetical protein